MSALTGKTVRIHHFLSNENDHFERFKLRHPLTVEVIGQRGTHMYGICDTDKYIYTFESEDLEQAVILDGQDGQLPETSQISPQNICATDIHTLDQPYTTETRFIEYINYMGIKNKDLQEVTGLSDSYFSHIRAGRRKLTLKVALSILNHYPTLNRNWLLKGEGDMINADIISNEYQYTNQPVSQEQLLRLMISHLKVLQKQINGIQQQLKTQGIAQMMATPVPAQAAAPSRKSIFSFFSSQTKGE